jgi:hypothetical protein
MRRLNLRVALWALAGVSFAVPAAAQTQTFHVTEPSRRPGISFGVTQLHERYGDGRGPEIDLLIATVKHMGLIVDASFNNFDGFSEASVMGGVRWTLRPDAALSPFGQLLAGVERCGACRTTDPTVEPAAGIDLAISRSHTVSVRVAAGYRITPSDLRTFKETHLFVGLSVRPGAR